MKQEVCVIENSKFTYVHQPSESIDIHHISLKHQSSISSRLVALLLLLAISLHLFLSQDLSVSSCLLIFPLGALLIKILVSKRVWKGYAWAVGVAAGFNASCAAIAAKFFETQLIKYSLVVLFNVTMWDARCYVNSPKALSSLQATVTNFATNFLTSGLAVFFLFEEALPYKWYAGASFIVLGVLVLNKEHR